ncbi:MAG: hypothetical protein COA58_16040 [Bacteroidetes bacterium]|nr:MAG: hypothetical protein COA58_16040 [Bacteroidota bacterium]
MKNVTILALGMLVTQLSFAQGEFRFGLKGAANFGWIGGTNKTIDNGGTTLGFGYGIMGDYYFKPNYGLSTEILLSQINSKVKLNEPQTFKDTSAKGSVTGMEYEMKLQYLEIPISMKFRTKEIGDMTYWGNFGFSPGFLFNAKGSITADNLPQYIKDKDPSDFNLNEAEGDVFETNEFDDKVFLFRFPLIIGGGIEYQMAGSTSLQGGIRFTNSFTDMFVKDKVASAKNNYFALSLGILF